MERAPRVFFLRDTVVFFYLVTTGWIFDINLCENSINQSKIIFQTKYGVFQSFLKVGGVALTCLVKV